MENFRIENPTTAHFGKDVIKNLARTIGPIGKKVLLIYGKGSIKKNGIYDAVMEQLKAMNAEVAEAHIFFSSGYPGIAVVFEG